MWPPILNNLQILLSRLTGVRAGYLDKLNISGSVASGADYTAARAAKLDNLDATVTSRAAAATALSTANWTTARAGKLDNLDALVSSRTPNKGEKVMSIRVSQTGTTEVTIANAVAGPGRLIGLAWRATSGSAFVPPASLKITVDGQVEQQQLATGYQFPYWWEPASSLGTYAALGGYYPLPARFLSTLTVKASGGSSACTYYFDLLYSTDI